MNALLPHPTESSWWVEVHTSAPQQFYCLGPFNSQAEAKISRSTHVEALFRQASRDISAFIKQF
jgi:hypothetical protein